jgi:hypothetical protein
MASRRVTAKTKIFELSLVLQEVGPAVGRVVQVPGEITLAGLHQVIQVAMGWTNDHLHEFAVAGNRYGWPDAGFDDEVVDEAKVKLFRLVGAGDRFEYVYDFGDGWIHVVTVEKVLAAEPGQRYPRCVSGQRACPPEDVGGPCGYEEFRSAIADPGHPEHAEFLDWVGGGFDPEAFDAVAVDRAFDRLAWVPLPPPVSDSTSASFSASPSSSSSSSSSS